VLAKQLTGCPPSESLAAESVVSWPPRVLSGRPCRAIDLFQACSMNTSTSNCVMASQSTVVLGTVAVVGEDSLVAPGPPWWPQSVPVNRPRMSGHPGCTPGPNEVRCQTGRVACSRTHRR
jgi:hypothetical protein